MKIIPKLQNGGSYDQFFTSYDSVSRQEPKASKSAVSAKEKDDDGGLKLSDFLNLIKDANGLPNELYPIISELGRFLSGDLSHMSDGALAQEWLSILYKKKIAEDNKAKFDEALKDITNIDAMGDPAIDMQGKIVVMNRKSGKFRRLSVQQLIDNKENYVPVSLSQLSYFRKYRKDLINDDEIISIMHNAMSYEKFQKLVDGVTGLLGMQETSFSGSVLGVGGQVFGFIAGLSDQAKAQIQSGMTLDGLYDYKYISKDQYEQIKAAITYITNAFPDNAKTWASYRTGETDGNKALQNLVWAYMLKKANVTNTVEVDYQKDSRFGGGSGGSSGLGDGLDINEGLVASILRQRGEERLVNILNGKVEITMSVHNYGTNGIDGLDSRIITLDNFITQSPFGNIFSNRQSITFGDQKLNIDTAGNITVDTIDGVYTVTLPKKLDGSVNLEIAKKLVDVKERLEKEGYKDGSDDEKSAGFDDRFYEELQKDGDLKDLYNKDGTMNRSRFGFFLFVKGYATKDAEFQKDGQTDNTFKIEDKYKALAPKSNSDQQQFFDLYDDPSDDIKKKISLALNGGDKDADEYDDDIYEGVIYIPLSPDPVAAAHADDTTLKIGQAQELDRQFQQKRISDWNSSNGLN